MDSSSSSSSSSELDDNDELNLSEEGSVNEHPLQWHGDHWDELLDYESPYVDTWDGEDWMYTHLQLGDRSVSNEQLSTNPDAQHWLQKLGNLSREDFPSLKFAPGHYRPAKVPLFRDEDTGDEYQILVNLSDDLIYVSCPLDIVPFNERARPLSVVIYQGEPSEGTQGDPELPRFVIPLGPLAVRSQFRFADSQKPSNPRTELTDYQVVIDAEDDSMPVWLLCSRRTLIERHKGFNGRNPQLPIFKGLMQYEEIGYDAACMLSSVHRLGDRLSFEETCDMVRRTRANVDPVKRHATVEKMEELIGVPVPESFD
ncbi:hypothetical protein KVR01_008952 [Diaporthe batatas]|uniref:uncharacterized protein n=1 Tax=Diaporthe batatas TaxID=748121 RepID=UPI001D0577A1|nr:uncharacterized protein KVR01_008952 [Diaporthe batatas]KAG8160688.1 hypothetical protein KVR01_008952 [Diaporthe batatas]